MDVPLLDLYRRMVRMRRFEESLQRLWDDGRISGELHLGIGEEATIAGVTAHLERGDAISVDHRSTPPFVGHGVDLEAMTLEMLGSERGLCRGRGGHMHLFDRDRLAASTGIVGASAPIGAGFALAAQQLRPGAIAVAFFGDGAANQGMLLETLNLASVWKLPIVFVCKDNGVAVSTSTATVTGGDLVTRARGFGVRGVKVDGMRVDLVWLAARDAVDHARRGLGPTFLHARVAHAEGHFLGDPIVRSFREPMNSLREIGPGLITALWGEGGATLRTRAMGLLRFGVSLANVARDQLASYRDPLHIAARTLKSTDVEAVEREVANEVEAAVRRAVEATEEAAA